MRFTGILGIMTLLAAAFLMSNNKKKIPYRTVIWGLGLQLIFAAIILGNKFLSFSAMLIFMQLVVIYILKDYINIGRDKIIQLSRSGLIILTSLASIILLFLLDKFNLSGWIFLAFILLLFVKAIFKIAKYQKALLTGIINVGFVWLFSHEFTGRRIFNIITAKVETFLALSDLGAEFLFGNLALKKFFFTNTGAWPGFGFQFAFSVLPVIIFFSAFMAILYHLGIMQIIIKAIARFMQWTMGTSGAETLSCTANIFVGQTEAPLLIRPFLNDMTNSELLTIMVGGFATIAGGVLAGYIALGISAGHLIAASVMSAPAALMVGKIIFPEIQHSKTAGDVDIPRNLVKSSNVLDAATAGVTDGVKLAVNVGAMLIAFIALIGFLDLVLSFGDKLIDGKLLNGEYVKYPFVSSLSPVSGEFNGIFPGSLKTFFGTLLRPLAWLMGVSWQYAGEVGNLLGVKLALTEFVAYGSLTELINNNILDEKAIIIATYALCGFANFASIGIQIGGISALAPSRRSDLSKIALKAMFGGAIASWLTASIAGILL